MARGRLKVADNALPDRIVIPDLDAVIVAGALHQADLIGFRLVIADPPADLRTLQASARWVVAAQEPEAGAVRFRGDTVVVTLRRDGGDRIREGHGGLDGGPVLRAFVAVAGDALAQVVVERLGRGDERDRAAVVFAHLHGEVALTAACAADEERDGHQPTRRISSRFRVWR